MKKLLITLGILGMILFVPIKSFAQVSNPGATNVGPANLWSFIGNKLKPTVASWHVQLPYISSGQFLHTSTGGEIVGTGSDCGSGGGGTASGTAGAIQFSNGSSGFNADQTKLFFNNSTKALGIGTSTPASALTVIGNGYLTGNLSLGNTPAVARATIGGLGFNNGIVGVDTGSAAAFTLTREFSPSGGGTMLTSAGDFGIQVANGSGLGGVNVASSALYITSSKNIGIGTTTPNAFTHIASASTTFTTLAVQATTSQTSTVLDIWGSTGSSLFNVTGGGNINVPTATASSLLMTDPNKNLQSVILGTNLSFSGNTLNATGGGGGGSISTSTNAIIGRSADWTGLATLGNGALFDNGTVAGVNATSSTVSFNVQGSTTLDPFQVTSSSAASNFLIVKNSGNVGIGTSTPSGILTVEKDAIGTIPTAGIVLTNGTLASSTVTAQNSASIVLSGNGWKTNATAASQQTEWDIFEQPFSRAVAPENSLIFIPARNGATGSPVSLCQADTSTTTYLILDGTVGRCDGSTGFTGIGNVGVQSVFGVWTNAGQRINFNNNGMTFSGTTGMNWASGAITTTITGDVGIARAAANTIQIDKGDNTLTSWGNLLMGQFSTNTTTITSATAFIQGTSTAPTRDLLTAASSSGSTYFTVKSTGNVGIGTTTPGFGLVVTGTAQYPGLTTSGGTQPGTACITSVGELVNDNLGGGCVVSSERYKTDIKPLDANLGLDLFLNLPANSYFYKKDWLSGLEDNPNYNQKQLGVIAENVAKIAPELVTRQTSTSTYDNTPPGTITGLQDFAHWLGPIALAFQQQQKEENWQWIVIGLLTFGFIYQQLQIHKLKKKQ